MKRWLSSLMLGLVLSGTALAQENVLTLEMTAPKQSDRETPLCVPISVPKGWAKFEDLVVDIITGRDVIQTPAQLSLPGIMTSSIKPTNAGEVRFDLHLVLPPLPAGQPYALNLRSIKTVQGIPRFFWTGKQNEYQELVQTKSGTSKPILRYMNRPYDPSSKEARDKTYKVFHHLYDPAGKRLVTNGGYADDKIADPKKLLYPHHRGIMYGFNKCFYGPDLKTQADTWHCPPEGDKKKKTPAAHVAEKNALGMESGAVLGRHRVLLGWYGAGRAEFVQEERELTVYNIKGGTLIEFASRLKPTSGPIRVDGDPQHAGFQFRAHNDVAEKTKKETYYLHPDGKGEKGKERNWPGDKTMVDLPWYALSFVLDDQRYTVCYLNHPNNPKETRFSERDYARFGGYFQRDVTDEKPLVVNYRLWLQNGEITQEQAQSLHTAFASPPTAVVKARGK